MEDRGQLQRSKKVQEVRDLNLNRQSRSQKRLHARHEDRVRELGSIVGLLSWPAPRQVDQRAPYPTELLMPLPLRAGSRPSTSSFLFTASSTRNPVNTVSRA